MQSIISQRGALPSELIVLVTIGWLTICDLRKDTVDEVIGLLTLDNE